MSVSHRHRLPALILASSSPRRKELLQQLGLRFRVVPSRLEEIASAHLTAREQCRINAQRKAFDISRRHPRDLVLGADTLVALGATVYGKPGTRAEAARMLGQLQGRTHEVVTAVCLVRQQPPRCVLLDEQTSVTFRSLDAAAIDRYLRTVDPLDKAGAYAIQEQGHLLIAHIDGSFSNVVGLPVERLLASLAAWPTHSSTSAR